MIYSGTLVFRETPGGEGAAGIGFQECALSHGLHVRFPYVAICQLECFRSGNGMFLSQGDAALDG